MNLIGCPNCVRCLSALLILGLVLVLVIFGVAYPWHEQNTKYDLAAGRAAERLSRLRGLSDQKLELEKRLQAAKEAAGKAPFYLKAESPALAGAELQSRIKAVVERGGGRVQSSQNLPVQDEGFSTRIGLRVNISSDAKAFSEMLYGLETESPVLFVENLSIRGERMRTNPKQRQSARQDTLNISFDLFGYLWGGLR